MSVMEYPWMRRPNGVHCLRGLEYLDVLDAVYVKHIDNPRDVEYDMANTYLIRNQDGENIYLAQELSNAHIRCVFGHRRAFNIVLYDQTNDDILNYFHPVSCDCTFSPHLQSLVVTTNTGFPLGKVKQLYTLCWPKLMVEDYMRDPIYYVIGTPFTCSFCFCGACYCQDLDFYITTARLRETRVGYMTKYWTRFSDELEVNLNDFGIRFSGTINAEMKACLLGACFLLDFMYFDSYFRYRCDLLKLRYNCKRFLCC